MDHKRLDLTKKAHTGKDSIMGALSRNVKVLQVEALLGGHGKQLGEEAAGLEMSISIRVLNEQALQAVCYLVEASEGRRADRAEDLVHCVPWGMLVVQAEALPVDQWDDIAPATK